MSSRLWPWIRLSGLALLVLVMAAAWQWTELSLWADADVLREVVRPYRSQWWAPLAVLGVFVVAELLLFPLLVLVFLCGVAFGPWPGALYALAGALASSVIPFFVGRKLGRRTMERWGGSLVRRMGRALDERGVIAVYVARKLPLPFTVTNLVCGASGVRFRDFLLGTVFGMGATVVLLAAFGPQVLSAAQDPTPRQMTAAGALALLGIALTLMTQLLLNRQRQAAP